MKKNITLCTALLVLSCASAARAQVSPYAGLWVGTASLTTVNEVSIPFDADNKEVAPDPLRPTPTGSRADVRLLVHVDAAGRASLLKDVAVVNRNASGNTSATIAEIAAAGSDEFSVALVTDPALYTEYPMQRATRYTSVVFDFGDAQATRVLDALVDKVATHAADVVKGKANSAVDTEAKRNQVAEDIVNTVKGWPAPADNVAVSFQAFLDDLKSQNALPVIAAGVVGTWMTKANALRDASAFGDARAAGMVAAIQGAGNVADAWNAASEFADTDNEVARLLASKVAGDALRAAARHASENPGATVPQLKALPLSVDFITAAFNTKKWANDDTRATGAVDAMFEAIALAAAQGHGEGAFGAEIFEDAYKAGLDALRGALAKFPGNRNGPGSDYTAFVNSAAFAEAREKAARAAALAVLDKRAAEPLTYALTALSDAKAAAENALRSAYIMAARAKQNELPLAGVFGLGQGDPRFMLDVAKNDALGASGLTGTILLPANYATNPFRHRRHPDHSVGYDVTRNIIFDFDAAEEPGLIPSVTRGVSAVSGIYREEFLGLHKPLGPGQDVGLRAEGRFELNRVSEISALNGK